MKIQDIKHLVENGGFELNKRHIDVLFKRIEDSETIIKRIKSIALVNNSHRDFAIIYDLTNIYLEDNSDNLS